MRVGVIGAGRVSGGHAAAVKSIPGLRLHAVAEPHEERREAFAQRHGCAAYADRREMLSDGEIDLALLGLPHWLHAPIAIDCLNAGVHTLVEKPMAVSLEECAAMTAAADANGVQLMVGHTQQFFQANLVTRQLLRDGRIGGIVMADECWHKSYGLAGRPAWFNDRAKGGGMWFMNGSHMVDRLLFLLESRVVSAKGMISHKIMRQKADDAVAALLHFENGTHAVIVHAGHRRPERMMEKPGYIGEIVGTEGCIRTEPYRGNVWLMTDEEYEPVEVPKGGGVIAEVAAFVEAVENGAPPPISNEHSTHVVEILLAVEQSSETGKEVRLD